MLKSLRIKNFQGHKDSFVEFSEGVTAIYGTTDHGKSSIIRALQIFFTQRPRGNRYIRRNQKDPCEIQVSVDNQDISFIRTKTTGKYIVGDDVLQALQGNVPDEVQNLINIDDINISGQFDPLFLILDTPGKAATKINAVTHLEKADDLIKNISNDLRDTNSKIKVYTEDLDKWKEDLSKFRYIKHYEKELKKAIEYHDRYLSLEKKENGLNRQKIAIIDILNDIDSIRIFDISELDTKINEQVEKYEINNTKITKLQKLIDDLHICYAEMRDLDKIDNIGNLVNIDKIEEDITEYEEIIEDIKILEIYVSFFKKITGQIQSYTTIINDDEDVVAKLMSQLDICETCGQELTKEAKEYMMKG